MSHAREMKIQKLQTKNRMTGQTFNPSGITSEQIKDRELEFVEKWKSKGVHERKLYWDNVLLMLQHFKNSNIRCSWVWEWCAFKRNFIFQGVVI